MTRLRPRPSRAAVAGLVAAAALALTGCSATNPITTLGEYDASDGAGVSVGGVRALNLLVVSAGEGEPGALSGALTNRSADDEEVTLTVAGGEPVEIAVAGGSSVLLGVTDGPARYATTDVPVAAVDTAPGGLTSVTITTSGGGTVELRIPVLDGTLPEYAPLLEAVTEGAAATPSPAATRDASAPEGEETQED
ncbi:hypothetical protein [Cellulomonas phragmiteti]|uniref:hypothetical protein n=1 Tax=Cellulomonas phragmiteti TaxID=478780 RepID=UPI001945A31F|nr:hypothetical protein [Cellulomonas phragmiteti]